MKNRRNTSKEIKNLAKRIVLILRDGGVVEASVFGSFARGKVHPDSDLDLLVRGLHKIDFILIQINSDSRFNEYIPSKPLIGLGSFSCLE